MICKGQGISCKNMQRGHEARRRAMDGSAGIICLVLSCLEWVGRPVMYPEREQEREWWRSGGLGDGARGANIWMAEGLGRASTGKKPR